MLENEALKRDGLEVMNENIRYKYTVNEMAKHIVYGNIINFIIHNYTKYSILLLSI